MEQICIGQSVLVHLSSESLKLVIVQVASGDVVILGSDGLWDNISVPDISTLVREELQKKSRPSRIAQKLVGGSLQR